MSELFAFASGSPFLTFFIAAMVLSTIRLIAVQPWRIAKRWLRSRDIRAHGWPPEHCDADGDFKPEPEAKP